MNVKETLIDILENAFPDYPVFLQGTLDENEAYPTSFITVWTSFTESNGFYDDEENAVDWDFNVMFYSSNPVLVNSVPDAIRTTLKAAGYIPQGKGNDLPSDTPTHTGWVTEYIYKEIL